MHHSLFLLQTHFEMDCKTASNVWNHEGGLVEGVRDHLPGVIEHLDGLVQSFINGEHDEFNEVVQEEVPGEYYVEHAPPGSKLAEMTHDVVGDEVGSQLLEKFFSEKYGQPIRLANICCGSCAISHGRLDFGKKQRLQMAAVNAPHPH